jgi:4-hydroxybenzoate polyprenyltransferase
MNIAAYVEILRIDYWFKNIFMLPGMILAVYMYPETSVVENGLLLVCLIATCLAASANYVINECFDANYDRYHSTKNTRPCVTGEIKGRGIAILYTLLIAISLGLAWTISFFFMQVIFVFLLAGAAYNIPPVRTKERVYLDVLSESFNNPIRFMLGWSVFTHEFYPPLSIIIAYWSGGAFLMAAKRLAEFRFIGDKEKASLYRRSFLFYTEEKLLMYCFFSASVSSFFLGIFLIKHRLEFLLTFPFMALLFTWYLKIALDSNSLAQNPEKLFQERGFMVFLLFLGILYWILMAVDIPWMYFLVE